MGTVVQAMVPRRVTFKSLPAVSEAAETLSKKFFWTPSRYYFQL